MRLLFVLCSLVLSFHANAYLTAKKDKPDPYARRHYTAADLPSAKAHAKKKAKEPRLTDDEIAAEIARENAGSATPARASKKSPPSVNANANASASAPHPESERAPAKASSLRPPIMVCKIPPKPSTEERFLISDSDGFEACNEHGGQVTAGNENDRALMNVKNAGQPKTTKK